MGIKISVITPTYNRAKLLQRCYDSLCSQAFTEFEWIIVDDGSTDNTRETVEHFISNGQLRIRYIAKKNGGKHSAHNVGVEQAAGELTVCVDSDDMLADGCLEEVWSFWKEKASENIIGVIGKRVSPEGIPLCSSFPNCVERVGMFTLNNKYHFSGDTVIFLRTDILKTCLFPIFGDEKFIPETAIYYKLDEFGEMLLMDKGLYIGEYQSDGLTSKYHKLLRQNPIGTAYTYLITYEKAERITDKTKYALLTMAYWNKECSSFYTIPKLFYFLLPIGRMFRKYRLDKL